MQTLIIAAIVAVISVIAFAKLRQFEADAARYGRWIDGEYDVEGDDE